MRSLLWPILCLCMAVITGTVALLERIPLNTDCSVFESIKAMYHDPANRTVVIELHPRRRHYSPTFLGRLSGTALYLLELKDHTFHRLPRHDMQEFVTPKLSKYTFTYQPVVDSGTYFLEFLVLFAARFNPNGFVNQCLESPQNGKNVVNAPFKTELIASSEQELLSLPTMKARWMLSEQSDPRYVLAPMPTRFQRYYCGNDISCEDVWAKQSAEELWQHRLYEWTGKPDWFKAYTRIRRTRLTQICLIGDSHSRDMVDYGKQLVSIVKSRTKGFSITMKHFPVHFPHEFNLSEYSRDVCDFGVVSIGQWPASYMSLPEPYTAMRYKSEMRGLMESLCPQNYTGRVKFLFHSVNYNALSSTITFCPPYDYRSVPVIQTYNAITKRLARELGLQYIDLTHIIGPMWDSAGDFCHPHLKVFPAEIEWILHQLFSKQPVQS